MKFWKKNKWFTFVEILWVLMIIAILLSISVVSFRHSQAKARDVIRKSDLQMIADALISYGNDHWHFPSSIYDNWQALTISQALNSIVNWWIYQPSWRQMKYYPNTNLIQNILWLTDEELQNYLDKYFDQTYVESVWEWLGVTDWDSIYTLKESINDEDFEGIASIIDINESEVPLHTNLKSIQRNMNYTIITQGMCASSLRKYLIDEWYISTIPEDPSWESVNLQTNICTKAGQAPHWMNANNPSRNISAGDCLTNTNIWCTQLCKEWYVYISDWEHFALIAHMENENWWNYETTACGSCEIEWKCGSGWNKTSWTKTDQLPCDITDEFKNTFDCIQENWVVEYSTWEYYFYIY